MNDPAPSSPTSDEITRRLRIVAELRNLCLSLGRARPLPEPSPGPDEAPVPHDPALHPGEFPG